jgi:hypothetical protein
VGRPTVRRKGSGVGGHSKSTLSPESLSSFDCLPVSLVIHSVLTRSGL